MPALTRMQARPDDSAASPGRPWTTGGHERSRTTKRSMGLSGAAADNPQESQRWRTATNLFVRSFVPSCLCVWSAVDGYNYPLVVIASRRHFFSNPAPGKTPSSEACSPCPQTRPASCPPGCQPEQARRAGPQADTSAATPPMVDGAARRCCP